MQVHLPHVTFDAKADERPLGDIARKMSFFPTQAFPDFQLWHPSLAHNISFDDIVVVKNLARALLKLW